MAPSGQGIFYWPVQARKTKFQDHGTTDALSSPMIDRHGTPARCVQATRRPVACTGALCRPGMSDRVAQAWAASRLLVRLEAAADVKADQQRSDVSAAQLRLTGLGGRPAQASGRRS